MFCKNLYEPIKHVITSYSIHYTKLYDIDETFIELTVEGNSSSTVKLIQEYNNLFILRAFTKILSIPGLRLGYGISNPSNITGMLKQKMPWSINCMAEGISAFLGMRLIEEYLNKTQSYNFV